MNYASISIDRREAYYELRLLSLPIRSASTPARRKRPPRAELHRRDLKSIPTARPGTGIRQAEVRADAGLSRGDSCESRRLRLG